MRQPNLLKSVAAGNGDINLDAPRRAFERLAQHHPMLRIVFIALGDEPVQRALAHADVDFRYEHAWNWHPAQLDARLGQKFTAPLI